MIKLEYIGEDDYMACLKNGDIFFAEAADDDGSWYIIKNKNGEEICLSKDEVVLY